MKIIIKTDKEILFEATETNDPEDGKKIVEKMDSFDNRIVKSVLLVPPSGTKLADYDPSDANNLDRVEITLEEEPIRMRTDGMHEEI